MIHVLDFCFRPKTAMLIEYPVPSTIQDIAAPYQSLYSPDADYSKYCEAG